MPRSRIWRSLWGFLGAWLSLQAAATGPFVGASTRGTAPLRVQFTAPTSGNFTAWLWYFGDEDLAAAVWTGGEPRGLRTGARTGYACTVLDDGAILLTGGDARASRFGRLMNDVWRSEDHGATWRRLVEEAPWPARSGHSCVALADGTLILLGGVASPDWWPLFGAWESIDRGKTWSEIIPETTSLIPARSRHACVPLADGSFLVIEGEGSAGAYHDVWQATNHGREWREVCAAAGWSARYDHVCVVLPDGGIVLTGGRDNSGRQRNDVWRSDDQGATWTQLAEHAPWSPRSGQVCVVLPDGSIILVGGSGGEEDVWRSADGGYTWNRIRQVVPRAGKEHLAGMLAHDGSLLLIDTDTDRQRIWRLPTAGSTERNPTHVYRRPGTYNVTLQTYGPNGAIRAIQERYIVVEAPLAGSVQGTKDDHAATPAAAWSQARSTSPRPNEETLAAPSVDSRTPNDQAPEDAPPSPGNPVTHWSYGRTTTDTEPPRAEPVRGGEEEEDRQLTPDAPPQTPLRLLPLAILALSLVLFLIGLKRNEGEPLEGRLFTAHVASLLLLSLVEIGYVVALREDSFWFCLSGPMTRQKVVLLCLLFCIVLVNQALCHVYALRDLRHRLGALIPWWWGLLSLPIALIAAAVCAVAYRPALTVVAILLGVAQTIQIGQLVYAVAPVKGRGRASLYTALYLAWTTGLAVATVGFLALLVISLFSLLDIAG